MTGSLKQSVPFNSPLETGVRALGNLVAAYPQALDLQRLVAFDHLVVHTGDVGGPSSLHPQIPSRSAELLVRRRIVERGILLMMSRGLVQRIVDENGITYCAGEMAETFLLSLSSPYLISLRDRSNWVVEIFGNLSDSELRKTINQFFDKWIEEFQVVQKSLVGDV